MRNKNRQLADGVSFALSIILTIFAIFIAYQIIRLILGGSWAKEDIITALLIFNLGVSFKLVGDVAGLKATNKTLVSSFNHLASDFKNHMNVYHNLKKANKNV